MSRNGQGRQVARLQRIESLERRRLLSAISFGAPVTVALNTTQFPTVDTAVADLNGDGIPDLAAARQDQSLQIFLGTSAGSFAPGVTLNGGGQVVAAADFNKDGKTDLATAGGLLPGQGGGTFGAPTAGSAAVVPVNTVGLSTGDFNGDGKLDLAAATFTPGLVGLSMVGVAVALGKGDGSFQSSVNTSIGAAPAAGASLATLVSGDFNGDGKLDLVSAFGVLLGKGDGTFNAPVPLVASGRGGMGGSQPASSLLAIADFNGDGKLDVATVPSGATSAGELELFMGNGDGTFKDAGPISLGNSSPVRALAATDVNSDGHSDLIVGAGPATTGGTTTTSGAVLVLPGNGDGTFAAGTPVAVNGTPLMLFTADFNADSKPDIVSVEGAATQSGSLAGAAPESTADVLLNTSQGTSGGSQSLTVTLAPSANPVATGSALQLTATFSAAAGAPAPTGNVTFFDGSTTLGTAPISSGVATLPVASLPIGVQSLTASYSGDANYAATTSAAVSETVLATTAHVPLLTAAIVSTKFPNLFLPGDEGSATVTVTNSGGGGGAGRVGINLYLSPDGMIDPSAVQVAAPSSIGHAVRLATGQSAIFVIRFAAPNVPPGTYTLLARLVPLARFSADEVSQLPAAAPSSLVSAGNVFGTVGRHHLSFTVRDASGNSAVLSLSGPGLGSVTQSGGFTDVVVSGSNEGNTLRITTSGAPFTFRSITVTGALKSFVGYQAVVTQSLSIAGGVSRVSLAAAGTPGGPGASVTLGGTTPVTLALGDMEGATLGTSEVVRSLTAAAWNAGAILAPYIFKLNVAGAMSASVNVPNGGRIESATVGTLAGGTWAVSGSLLSLRVMGAMANARIFAGADAGPDNVLGTADDVYRRAMINSIFVGGDVTSSLVAAGAAPLAGQTIDSAITLIPRSAIRSILVGGALSGDSRFLAASLPQTAFITGARVATAGDPRFHP